MTSRTISVGQADKITAIVSYLIVLAITIRGYFQYPHVRIEVISLCLIIALLLFAEPAIKTRGRGLHVSYLLLHIAAVVALFLVELDGDIWSVLLIPACIFAVRTFDQPAGWIWVGVMGVVMSVMLVLGHDTSAPGYIIVYLAAYLLVGSYASMLQQTQEAQQTSQELLRQLRVANQQLRLYNQSVEELTAIKERNRIARELHDSVTQSIFSMTLITQSALMLQEKDPAQLPDKLTQLQGLAQGALAEMRTLISQLRSLSVADDGLYPILQKHIAEIEHPDDLTITLVPFSHDLPLNAAYQQEIFRVIQEALNNVIKHSQATEATVDLVVQGDAVKVTVKDNGIGFDMNQRQDDRSHIGLASMRERASELNGALVVESQSGTTISLMVPIPPERIEDGRD